MEHKRRFMAFTTEGFITCRAEAAFNAIEIEFADVHTNRPVRFNDYSGFTMAAMGSAAAIFASPGDGKPAGETASVVHYRAFSSWAPNADWTLSLPAGEQAGNPPRCAAGVAHRVAERRGESTRAWRRGSGPCVRAAGRERGSYASGQHARAQIEAKIHAERGKCPRPSALPPLPIHSLTQSTPPYIVPCCGPQTCLRPPAQPAPRKLGR